jgi:hypothetical protein
MRGIRPFTESWGAVRPVTYPQYFLTFSSKRWSTPMSTRYFPRIMNQLDEMELTLGYFQQDGAKYRTSNQALGERNTFLGKRIIAKGHRPPRLKT